MSSWQREGWLATSGSDVRRVRSWVGQSAVGGCAGMPCTILTWPASPASVQEPFADPSSFALDSSCVESAAAFDVHGGRRSRAGWMSRRPSAPLGSPLLTGGSRDPNG